MKNLFAIPGKYFVSEEMKESLENDPLVIADVGSAMGIDDRWAPVLPYLEIVSFEPDDRSGGSGTVFRTALGKVENEERVLHLAELPAASSLYPHHPEMFHFVVHEWIRKTGETTIPVTTLDSCLEGKSIDFLKIDVEGADLDVLIGAEKSLQNVLAVQIEVSFTERHIGAPLFSEIDIHLRERGFHLHHISSEHWMRENAQFGSATQAQLIWGDAIYLRDEMEESKLVKWALILQAYGFQDYAMDKMPVSWTEVIQRSIRGNGAYLSMALWRWGLATLLLPLLWSRAWPKWKQISADILQKMHRLAIRCGPKKGIFPHA